MTISDNLMGALAPLPVLIPMLAAAATLVVGRRPRFQRVITLIALVGVVAVSGLLLYLADRDGTTAVQVGGWDSPHRHHTRGRPSLGDDARGLVGGVARRHDLRDRSGYSRRQRGPAGLDLPADLSRIDRRYLQRVPRR